MTKEKETRPISDCNGEWHRSDVVGWWPLHKGGWVNCPIHKDTPPLSQPTANPPKRAYVAPTQILRPALVEKTEKKKVKVKAKGRKVKIKK